MAAKDVLVIHMERGEIDSMVWDHREVYTGAKGREYIKTRSDGNVEILDVAGNRVAAIAYRREPSPNGNWLLRRKYKPTWADIEHALAQRLSVLGLDEAAASMV